MGEISNMKKEVLRYFTMQVTSVLKVSDQYYVHFSWCWPGCLWPSEIIAFSSIW